MKNATVVIIGNSWLIRQGLKPMLHELKLVLVGEGDDIDSTFGAYKHDHVPDLVLFVDYRLENVANSVLAIKKTPLIGPETIKVVVSDMSWAQEETTMLDSNIDAILSSTLSCEMLANALELIMTGHRIFARPSSRPVRSPPRQLPVNDHDAGAAPSGITPTRANGTLANQECHDTGPKQATAALLVQSSVSRTLPQLGATPEVPRLEPCSPRLSQRERQTLRRLVLGRSNKAIANELGMAETTVKVHVKSLLRKLRAANRTQAAIWAMNNSQLCDLDDKAVNAPDGSLSNESVMERLSTDLQAA